MNYEGACTERQINCSRGLRMSKKSSNFVVGTDYAEEIPTSRDLALRPFLLSEKSEIFRVAMRGRRNGLRGRNPDLSGFGAPSVPPLRKIRDFSGCHAGWSGGGHILRRLNEWLAESCKLQVSG